MIRRRLGSLLVLVIGAGVLSPLVARAQTTTTTTAQSTTTVECRDVRTAQDLTIEVCFPPDDLWETAEARITVKVRNDRKDLLGRSYSVSAVNLEVLRTLDDQQLPQDPTYQWPGPADSKVTVDWTTVFTTNGAYDLRIVAEGNGPGGQRAEVTVPMKLGVAPHAPTGVKAAPGEDGTVTITWNNADREPDLLFYEVSRAPEGSTTFEQVEVVQATVNRFADAPPAGAWRYRVTALRRGATLDQGIPSVPTTTAVVEVAASEAGATEDGSSSTTAAGSSTAGQPTTTVRPSVSNSPRSTIDLSGFASSLPTRRTPTTLRRFEPDPGFSQTLPFDVDAAAREPEPATPPLEIAEAPEALGEELISDDGERRRSLGFVAFGLLLFVLGMTGLFLKAEVRRVDELETIDDGEAEDAVPPPAREPVALVATSPSEPSSAPAVAAPLPSRRRLRSDARAAARAERAAELAALFGDEPPSTAADDDRHLAELAAALEADAPSVRPDRRVRRTVAPIDAPGLDVPDPVATPSTTRTAAHARRAPTRLPSRPADDRREGGAAVRAGRRRAGQGHRRVPLG